MITEAVLVEKFVGDFVLSFAKLDRFRAVKKLLLKWPSLPKRTNIFN
jgi:hypothetical protein